MKLSKVKNSGWGPSINLKSINNVHDYFDLLRAKTGKKIEKLRI